jgi:hypothetical protein
MGNIYKEPKITVNNIVLNDAHAMTIRAALNHMALDLRHDGLGDDAHGKKMTELYLERIKEINAIIFKGA